MKIDGTAAFVTGGARGIGRAICESLLQRGGKVCFVDLDGEEGHKTEAELKSAFPESDVIFLQCDVTKQEDFVEAYKKAGLRFGHIEIHVNNAGILSERNWSRMIDVNLKGVVEGTYVALDHMRKDKGGRGGIIINMSSSAGLQPVLYVPVYTAAKFAVVGFTLSWAEEQHFQEHGVRLNVICPQLVDTELSAKSPSEVYHREQYVEILKEFTMMTASRVADAVLQIIENDQDHGKIVAVAPDSVHYHQMAPVSNTGSTDGVRAS